jgi:hypothetical protein
MLDIGLPVSMYTTKSPIDMRRYNIPQLKEFWAFSVKGRYQLNYFICIKDFNSQTITSLKLNFFSSFIYCCQHRERKAICLDILLLSDRQWGDMLLHIVVNNGIFLQIHTKGPTEFGTTHAMDFRHRL